MALNIRRMALMSIGRAVRTVPRRLGGQPNLRQPAPVNATFGVPLQQRQYSTGPDVVEVASEEEFNALIEKNSLVAVDFFASWCGPCKMIAPVFKTMAEDFPKVKFVKVDADKLSDLAGKYGVSNIPHFLFMKDGQVVDTMIGASKPSLKAKLEALQ